MRALKATVILACSLGSMASTASAQKTLVETLLKNFQPMQAGVDYDSPIDAAAIAACKAEEFKQGVITGYVLRDGQGQILRKFINLSGKRHSDGKTRLGQWGYYKDGFEVYRDVDLNDDNAPDESRWMNSGGTRTALVKGRTFQSWKRISAEEASKVFVQAVVAGDLALLGSVVATSEELKAIGLPKSTVDQAAAAEANRSAQFKAMVTKLGGFGWNKETTWQRLDGQMPHLIPADAGEDLKDDIVLYENAVVFAGPADGKGDLSKIAYLQVPELIKIGETWKLASLPNVIDPSKAVIPVAEGGIRAGLYRAANNDVAAGDPAADEALKALADYDNANAAALAGGDKKEAARYYVGRIPLLRAVVKVSTKPDDQLVYNKQIADSLAEAYQSGLYKEGLALLDALAAEGGKVSSYAAFRQVNAEYARENDDPAANPVVVQKDWMKRLEDFLKAHPASDEAPDALLQLAGAHEFNADEDLAQPFYSQLAAKFPDTKQGKKAAGALRRLELVGKPIELKGEGTNGKTIDAAQFRGRTLLITFWASWAAPVRRDQPELVKLQSKYTDKGFSILGVNLDADKASLDEFLKANPASWSQIHEAGGMEGRLANDFGIISLPTMILVDPQGKVINRNIRSAADLENQLEKSLAAKSGVALGGR